MIIRWIVILSVIFVTIISVNGIERTKSIKFVAAMGAGWNLGNTFDSFDTNGDKGEKSWGNPVVTKELLKAIKKQGFKSIRLPMSTVMRISDSDTNYTINPGFINRYKEVVDWALSEGFYVMINIHHDSWSWLNKWNGDKTAAEYVKFVRIWEQLASLFKDYNDRLMFESINEPQFSSTDGPAAIKAINEVFYQTVRNSGGNNGTRMLVLPLLNTDAVELKCKALYDQIKGFNDENIIATFHYYSEWVYSANLGKTRFDEVLWDTATPRTSLDATFKRVNDIFIENGIGVICGEYGLLGFDKSDYCNENGETLKFIEYINYKSRELGICQMLWDNGQHFDRKEYEWKNPSFGNMVTTSMKTRSSYATGLDYVFLSDKDKGNYISIPLTLNDNKISKIYDGKAILRKNKDYAINNTSVVLKPEYTNRLIGGDYGIKAELTIKFSKGTDWTEYLAYSSIPVLSPGTGTTSRFSIPVDFKGDRLEKTVSKDIKGNVVSNNSWWQYLQYDSEFTADYKAGLINMLGDYFKVAKDGSYNLTFTFYSGKVIEYNITVSGTSVTGN